MRLTDRVCTGGGGWGGWERDAISLICCGFVMAKAVLDLEGLEAGNVTLLAGSAVICYGQGCAGICKGLGLGEGGT